MLVAGVDEAGRGCVLGPLVIAGFLIKEENLPVLVQLGVKIAHDDVPYPAATLGGFLVGLLLAALIMWRTIRH